MRVCVCVCVYACVYVCMCVCVYVCVCVQFVQRQPYHRGGLPPQTSNDLLLWQVVTPAQITFFVDGKNSSAVHLARPITDCVGQALEIGDDDIPQLGEITFFARALSEVEMHVRAYVFMRCCEVKMQQITTSVTL